VRRETDRFIGCELSPRERATVDEMKRRVGLAADANLVRTALYRFALHCEVRTDTTLFHVRSGRRPHQR
jgi:hypothetical protein